MIWVYVKSASGITYDTDAEAFFTAAGITDVGQKNAVNDLVLSLKADSLWSKMTAIYPFVGGSASTHAVNLKSPGTYDLTFYGGWTHNSNGITGNASTGYADTGINENSVLTLNDTHLSIYSRTNKDALMCDIGLNFADDETNIFSKFGSVFYPRVQNTNSGISNTGTSQRLFITNRVGSTAIRAYQDGTLKTISNSSVAKTNGTIVIGGLRRVQLSDIAFYTDRNYAFASVGSGLSDTNMTDLTDAVNTYQTDLSRNV
jgi:hypothetical protein